MFTGLIERTGRIDRMSPRHDGAILRIALNRGWGGDDPIKLGESIAVNGVCLTVTRTDQATFDVDVLQETLKCTNLGVLDMGSLVNLERAMRANARFGGHVVSGHVDATGRVESVVPVGDDWRIRIRCSPDLLRGIVHKGSIALDGISLTVALVDESGFEVHIIPVTFNETNVQTMEAGDSVNLETDMLGKYVQKALAGR